MCLLCFNPSIGEWGSWMHLGLDYSLVSIIEFNDEVINQRYWICIFIWMKCGQWQHHNQLSLNSICREQTVKCWFITSYIYSIPRDIVIDLLIFCSSYVSIYRSFRNRLFFFGFCGFFSVLLEEVASELITWIGLCKTPNSFCFTSTCKDYYFDHGGCGRVHEVQGSFTWLQGNSTFGYNRKILYEISRKFWQFFF